MNQIARMQSQPTLARVAVVAALLAWACGQPPPKREWTPADHGQPAPAGPEASEESADPSGASGEDPTERAARALFTATCASCHGRDGRGHGEGLPPGARPADFTDPDFQRARSDEQLALVVRDGRGMMPPFGKRISEAGIAVLVQYIRRLPALGANDAVGALPGNGGDRAREP